MEQFLINIEKYRVAILGTVLFHILIFVVSSFSQVQNVSRMPPQEIRIEIPLDDIEFDPAMQEILEQNEEVVPQENEKVANIASDANDSREKSYEDYSTNSEDLSEDAYESAKALEAAYFEEAAANNPANQIQAESHVQIKTKSDQIKVQDRTGGKSGSKSYAGKVMISFNLEGRKAHSLPNPGYTCENTGTVVVEIKVDESGAVKDAKYRALGSYNATECLINRAVQYAAKARFDFKKGGVQTGTIIYKFIGQ
ncbi:hypothetical protein DNU06_08230 [Putridiphycobacter roseus]|uniref:Energy transducer TonB n=1 Tax=Putridiphycobacter roseus TaxID=2219161 RepID=A0A2W1N2P0_9FLAO|nr:hypothetical protein [Putridiphycobacter roseus]PZE17251.1 hypothetical protein DNU06_08230 [Putridiphycobacter roseus]